MTSTAGLPRPDRQKNGARPDGPDCFLGVEKSLTGKRCVLGLFVGYLKFRSRWGGDTQGPPA